MEQDPLKDKEKMHTPLRDPDEPNHGANTPVKSEVKKVVGKLAPTQPIVKPTPPHTGGLPHPSHPIASPPLSGPGHPIAKPHEATQALSPRQALYEELDKLQGGRNLSDIPHDDPYYKKRDEIHQLEAQLKG